MILAAGLGTRMRPLTHLLAKPALPVLNRPLLHWTLDMLRRHGVREVVVNTHHLPATVRRAVEEEGVRGLRVRFSHEPRILGTGGALGRARRWLGKGTVLVVNGDVLFDFDLGPLLRRHRESGAEATLALLRNPDPRRYSAVVTSGRGWIRSFRGGPRTSAPGLFTGLHVLEGRLLERLPAGPSDSVRDLYEPLMAEGGRVLGVRVEGAWYDFGSPPLYLASQLSMLASGFRGVARGALVDPSARVHPTARVVRAVVGPGVTVGPGPRVTESVLWAGARVGEGARVRRCILATGVRVGAGEALSQRVVLRLRGRRTTVEMAGDEGR
jgi:NDP-sugar pyrophosphorylase family protein